MRKTTLATMYGIGLIRIAPGTAGSLVAALLAYPILLLPMGWAWLTVGALLFTVLGTRSASKYMRRYETSHDPSEIVVDELVGQWLTYSCLYGWLAAIAGNQGVAVRLIGEVAPQPLYIVLGFVLFRFFDILKPWPISWADRRVKGGFGVMFDDILAAIPAGTVLYLIYFFMPVVLGNMETIP
ncbi:MAG: phosphatidylglycerophosphatase A [Pseudomonadota bacterium]